MILDINNQKLDLQTFNKYIVTDSSKMLDHFSESSPFIDLIITSPPYWDAKQYGDGDQIGFGQSYESYLESLRDTFRGVYELSKPTASLYLIVDTIKRNGKVLRLQDDISNMLESIGWIHQDTIIWDKGKTLPWSRKGQMRNVFEYVLFFTKSFDYKYNIDAIKTVDELKEWWQDYPERYSPVGKVPDNIWRFNIPTQGSWGAKAFGDEEFRHACPFPPEMMARIIKLSSNEGDVVFDPFSGTGVLLAVAELLGRKYLGMDTNNQYKNIFEKVTRPLVAKQWPEIQKYYQIQEQLQEIMRSVIYRLRMLKYPKALIKRVNKIDEFKTTHLKFSSVIAVQESITEGELKREGRREIIGKVHYYFVLNSEQNDSLKKHSCFLIDYINEIVAKAPFSKYGLITKISIMERRGITEILDSLNNSSVFVYLNGNTKSYALAIQSKDVLALLHQNRQPLLDKDFPPIISNIGIREEEYAVIPAEKYHKHTLLENLVLDI